MTIITTTFIPCGAKLPIIALISGVMFGRESAWVATGAFFIGIAAIVVSGLILKKTKLFAGDPSPFVMELPAYHMPTLKNVLYSMWERGWSFIKKAGTVILLSTVVLWFMQNYGFDESGFGAVDINDSLLSLIGTSFAWLFVPLGWGIWQAAVATVTGLIAKENVVATLALLYGIAEASENGAEVWGALSDDFTRFAAFSFLVFNLLCAPCFAAIGAIRREMNSTKWTFFALGYQTLLAYVVSMCIYQIGTAVTAFEMANLPWIILSGVAIVFVIFMLARPYKEATTLKTK
jgi:ferrous iron transport protein B